MATGREFQRAGPVTENVIEPSFVLVRGTYKMLVSENRSCFLVTSGTKGFDRYSG